MDVLLLTLLLRSGCVLNLQLIGESSKGLLENAF